MTFNLEIRRVREYLCKNSYPPHLFDKQLQKYIDKKENENAQNDEDIDENKKVSYLKLPFIGTYPKLNKIKHLTKHFCKNMEDNIVFT